MEKQCTVCSKKIIKSHQSSKIWERVKFCSHKCYWLDKKGRSHNHGHKISLKLKGIPKSPEHIKNVADANRGKKHPSMQGEGHHAWKGDNVNYGSLHDWVARYRGREKKCDECGICDKEKYYHWANISGEYKRDLNDWIRLCTPCHSKMDKGRNSMKKVWKKFNNEYIRI
jgi:hypothetical protein